MPWPSEWDDGGPVDPRPAVTPDQLPLFNDDDQTDRRSSRRIVDIDTRGRL